VTCSDVPGAGHRLWGRAGSRTEAFGPRSRDLPFPGRYFDAARTRLARQGMGISCGPYRLAGGGGSGYALASARSAWAADVPADCPL